MIIFVRKAVDTIPPGGSHVAAKAQERPHQQSRASVGSHVVKLKRLSVAVGHTTRAKGGSLKRI